MTNNSSSSGNTLFHPESMSSIDNDTLIDLLAHKTRLLIAASIARLPDQEYVQCLNRDVEAIQKEIKKRMD